MLRTRYSYVEGPGEVNTEPSMVEAGGYIPTDVRVREFELAGMRLQEYREEAYDSSRLEEGQTIEDLPLPVTRMRNFDMADGTQIALRTKRLVAAEKKRQQDMRAEAEKANRIAYEARKEAKREENE